MTSHPRFNNLGEWISFEYGDQGALADALKPKVAKNTVSSWKTGKNDIPGDYRKQLIKLGYDGPWPQEEAKEASAPAGGPFATASEVAELRGAIRAHVEQWERGTEKLLERLEALARKVDRLAEGGR